MLLYNITNVDKLYNVLDRCSGNVELTLPDGKTYNWKENRTLLNSIATAMPVKTLDNVGVKLDDYHDVNLLVNYMMQAA